MKKQLLLCVAAAFSIFTAMATGPIGLPVPVPSAAASATDNSVEFVAAMNQSSGWYSGNTYTPQYGIYSFDNANSNVTAVSAVNTSGPFAEAAVYVDGKYYAITSSGSWLKYTTTVKAYDTDTWIAGEATTLSNSDTYASDLTYDYTTATVYAVTPDGYNTANPMVSTMLRTMDLESSEMTTIGKNGCRLFNIAADAAGNLYGVGVPLDVSIPTALYSIDKSSGAATAIAELDIDLYTASSSSATFDLRTGKMYLSAVTYVEDEYYQRTYTYGLYEINTATGSITLARTYPTEDIFAGLAIKDCHPKAPEAVKNLAFAFDAGSTTTGKVQFTLPTLTYDGSTLSGTLRVEVYVDGELKADVSGLTPGASYATAAMTLTAGSHTVRVYCYSGALKSVPADAEVFAGTDSASQPGDLTVTANTRGDEVTISWTAPTTGANGGYIDPTQLRYDILLKPDNITIASDLSATTFDYTFVGRKMGITQFVVTPKIDGQAGTPAASDVLLLGSPWPIPYLENFYYSSQASWPFTLIDANNDASDEWGYQWYFDTNRKAAWYYTTPNPNEQADDWLITPSIALEAGKVYRVQFDTYGYMGGTNTFEVTIGNAATVEAQKTVVLEQTYNTALYSITNPLSVSALFIPAEGDCRIGIHNISEGSDHMFVDNIYVDYYGSSDIPGAATNLTAEKTNGKVVLAFNAPSVTAGGAALTSLTSVKVYRTSVDGDLLTTIDAPAPGAALSYTDNSPVPGMAKYVVVAANASGTGLEASVEIDTNADIPLAVENIEVTGRNGWTEAFITWNYPESMVGVNGLPLSDADLSYDIYRIIGVYTTLIAQNVKGNSYLDSDCANSFTNGNQQSMVSYKIISRTSGGEGAAKQSANKLMGQAYNMPFHESWTDQSVDNYPWTALNLSGYGSWSVAGSAYDPRTDGQDGFGLASFTIASSSSRGYGDYMSPRIDVSTYANPTISFYLFHSTDANTANSTLQVGLATEESEMWFTETFNVYGNTTGWQEHTLTIPANFAISNRLSVVFRGYATSSKGRVHIDNLNITGQQPEYEVRVNAIRGSENCLIGNANIYGVEIENLGTKDVDNISVSLYADGELVSNSVVALLEAETTTIEQFSYTPSLNNTERYLQLRAVISAAKDASSDNNEIETGVSLVAPMLPYVNDLTGSSKDATAILAWGDETVYPHVEYITDDVTAYEAFAIDNVGDWTMVDADGQATVRLSLDGSTVVDWPNSGQPQAFMVFNPEDAGLESIISPRTGDQCFISFAAQSKNDDWLISPQLSGEAQALRFYAKCLYPNLLTEKFEVWVSSSTRDLSAFTCISGTDPVIVASATQWTMYTYDLPQGSKYFAIRCVSENQFGLMIDDITYSPVYSPVELWGFNIYRDGQKITDEPHGDYAFTDRNVVVGEEYTYHVSAVYDSGESIYSNPVTVRIVATGLADITAATIDIHAIQGGVLISGAEGRQVYVYAVDGRQVYGIVGTGSDALALRSGIYIVRAGETVAKVVVR